MDEEKLKALYDAGSKNYDLGAYEEFAVKMESPDKRKTLYDNLSKQFDLGTYEEYEDKLKKKLSANVGPDSAVPSGVPDAPTAEKNSKINQFGFDPN